MQGAQRRRLDVVVQWRLERLGRKLNHLITLLDELQVLGVEFLSLSEGIDATPRSSRAHPPAPSGSSAGASSEVSRTGWHARGPPGSNSADHVVVAQEGIAAVSHSPDYFRARPVATIKVPRALSERRARVESSFLHDSNALALHKCSVPDDAR